MLKWSPLKREDGQAAAEMALVLPILTALVLAIVQFGIAFNNYLTITDAARIGARKAAVSRFTGDDGAAAVTAVKAASAGLDLSNLGITVDSTDWTTPGTDVTVTVTYPYTINILGWAVTSGNLTSTTKESLE